MKIIKKNIKKNIFSLLMLLFGGVGGGLLSSCSDYLEIFPENQLAVDKFWASKEDVESSLNAGYYYLRASVEDYLIPWGEQRAGVIYGNSVGSSVLQKFQIKVTSGIASWAQMYKVINQANLVLANATKAQGNDATYTNAEVNSHYCEAYFLRALAYFYVVRNWREAPLITVPYETDETTLQVAKSSEADIIAQIKSDLQTAITLDAAKSEWDTTWETKGKATKWSIYALMADVCLWNQDFDEAIKYCDLILDDTTGKAPRLITTKSHDAWFAMFNPGNSQESIFEIQWNKDYNDGTSPQTNGLFTLFYNSSGNNYFLSEQTLTDAKADYEYTVTSARASQEPQNAVRTLYGNYYTSGTNGYVWKYLGGSTINDMRTSSNYDNNFIIYRVADIILLKAEALIMRENGKNATDNQEAIDLVNQIRERTNLDDRSIASDTDLETLIGYVLYERNMELLGEGKAWYDFLRIGRYGKRGDLDFKSFFINKVVEYNKQANESWIRSVLMNENAWYLPIKSTEMEVNNLLVQNPYYQ